ncbi:MAG: gamma-glutamyl-gamma-aminobutyrate hydrolase family protein [Bacilli bacterium]|nr:gamma-glutamyl-gamma-aminobutyrate hydrolase family protein [Bacilli bacterium]
MDNIIVGIIPSSFIRTDDNPYHDTYNCLHLYVNKLEECNASCIGLIPKGNIIPENLLDKCDAFLIQGGQKISFYHYQVIEYAIKNNKPLLGICMGMQAIGIYSKVMENVEIFNEANFYKEYDRLKSENEESLLERLEEGNIHSHYINYDNYKTAYHKVQLINKSSILYDVYKVDEKDEVSLHDYKLKYVGNNFTVGATTNDNVIEEIEYNNKDYFIVGTLFHVEWDEDKLLFKRLIDEAIKRRNII